MLDVLRELIAAIDNRQPVALATVIDVQGASPALPGFKLFVWSDGRCIGNIGGGELEKRIRNAAKETIKEGRAWSVLYSLKENGKDAIGMLCGGEVTVFIEPYIPRPLLLIVGGGHIGRPLSELAHIAGYEVKIVDVRAERGDRSVLTPEEITPNTYVVLITEDHVTDERALRDLLPTPASYIGMIGSQRKIRMILDHLREDDLEDELADRFNGPIGLDLGGREPAQIALSILAEVEKVRHGGTGRPRSEALKERRS